MLTGDHRRALELLTPHCDIVQRLRDVPPSARVRGLYFKSITNVLGQNEKLAAYEAYFPRERWSPISHYPLREYLIRLAVAGAVMSTPETLHDGIFDLTRQNASAFASSVLGRVLIRFLAKDTVKLTEQALAGRRQSTTYGEWKLVKHGPRDLEVTYRDEYMWIESAIHGAAMGTYAVCDIQPTLTTTLETKYAGSTRIRW